MNKLTTCIPESDTKREQYIKQHHNNV